MSRPQALSRGVFGWDPVRLSAEYSADECAAAIVEISADPASANPAHAAGTSIELLTKQASKKTDALSWAIFYIKQSRGGAS